MYTYTLLLNLSTYLVFIYIWVNYKLIFTTTLNKFLYFLLSIFISSICGFFYNLDGMLLILLTTEFTVVFLLLMTYTQLSTNLSFNKNIKSKLPLILIIFSFLSIDYVPIFYISYYNFVPHIISSDFYILYFMLFTKLPAITLIIIFIISLFSLFFILIYYNLKFQKNSSTIKLKQKYFIRKQNLLKQTAFTNKIYTYQN